MKQKETILSTLRELYKKDVEFRSFVAESANSFKSKSTFNPRQFSILTRRLKQWAIPFDETLFYSALSEPLLTVELVPRTCWYSNIRGNVDRFTWDNLRKKSYKKAGYLCEICSGQGPKWPVECHEIWHYDDEQHIQSLQGLISLCPDCHQVKHIGLTGVNGQEKQAKNHLAKINKWSPSQTEQYLDQVWQIWSDRSKYEWELDLTYLERLGVKVEQSKGA